MAQNTNSSRLTNTSLNVIGPNAQFANYGSTGIGATGNFDIRTTGTMTLGSTTIALGPATSSTVNVGGNLSTGSLFLGNTAGTSTLYGSTITIGHTASTVNIGGTGSTVRIGNTGGSTNVSGTLSVSTINGPVTTSAMGIGNNLMAGGTITLGNTTIPATLFGSTVQIGNTGSVTTIGGTGGTITIGATGTTINIGTILNGAVSIGNANATTALNGSASVTTLNSTSASTAMNIGNNLTTGNLNIGTTSTGVINIGNTGTTSTANSIVNIGVGATGVFIGTGSTGAVTIGNANGITKLNGPLTLGAAPSSESTTFMGSVKNVVVSTSAATSTSGAVNIATFTLPSAGSWLVNVTCGWASGVSDVTLSISTSSGNFQNNAATTLKPAGWINFSYPLTVQSSIPMYLVASTTSAIVSVSPIWVFIARIG